MSQSRWTILQTYPMPDDGLDILRAVAEVKQVFSDDPAKLAAAVAGCDGIVAGTEPITAAVIAAGSKLKVIGRFGAGVDSVDVKSASDRGIPVLNTPAVNAQTVVEHAFALMLGLSRRLAEADKAIRATGFELRPVLIGMELQGKTLGVVGLGNIGSKVARMGNQGFGMKLLATTARPDPERLLALGVEGRFVGLAELLAESDVVTLHAAVNAQTKGMIGRAQIARMKPGSYLINTARGGLVDEPALIDALQSGHLRGAGLDVYAVEPPSPDNPLLALPNVVLTPHISSNSTEAFSRMGIMVCKSMVEFLNGGQPSNCVNPQVYGKV